jgi:hypothetical protein
MPTKALPHVTFVDNPVTTSRKGNYMEINVKTKAVIESWRISLFSYEWITPEGRIKTMDELSATEQPKRKAVEDKIRRGEALEKPILGIGLMENVEIGSGRATLLTLAAQGIETIPVHIPVSNEDEFEDFI